MKNNLIPFEEAIRWDKGIIKDGDQVIITELYDDEKAVTLYPENTGCKEKQYFSREKDLNFFYAETNNYIPVFWGETTKSLLQLEGETGALDGNYSINKACSPWTNTKMGLISFATTLGNHNDLMVNKKGMHDRLEQMTEPAWLGQSSSCIVFPYNHDKVDLCLDSISGFEVKTEKIYTENHPNVAKYGVRPAVFARLKCKIAVDMERSHDRIWVLVPNKC